MTSIQALREFIGERLTAAAGEIFTVFEHIIVEYEREIARQRRLLEITWKPQVQLHRIELPQHHDHMEEECYPHEQEEPEPAQIEEEQVEVPELQQPKEDQENLEPAQIEEEQLEEPGLQQSKEDQENLEPPQIGEEQLEEPGLHQFKENQEEQGPPQTEEHEEFGTDWEQSYCSQPKEVQQTEQFFYRHSEVQDLKNWFDTESSLNPALNNMNIFHHGCVDNVPEKPAECQKVICEICGKNYSRQATLMAHMRTHTGERPYPCETCGKSFSHQSSLTAHRKTHNEKLYSCEVCWKRFGRQDALLRHIKTHTGERPYSCETCGKSFGRQDALLVHMRTHKEMQS